MSMQAQAERERQARVILGDFERQIAVKFEEAAKTYANNPTALHLRAMNMLYEGLKQNSTFVIVPSSALETMQLGAPAGVRPQANGVARSDWSRRTHGKQVLKPVHRLGKVSTVCLRTWQTLSAPPVNQSGLQRRWAGASSLPDASVCCPSRKEQCILSLLRCNKTFVGAQSAAL